MSFDAIMGQDAAKAFLRAAMARDRLGHAYLFTGRDGVGKSLLARELAKALLCRAEGDRPCDACGDCHRIDSDTHPDLSVLQSEDGGRFIKIKQVQELSHTLNLKPVQSDRRVAVVREAERMNQEAANALLKTLEEPASYVTLILTTSRPRSLPDTIRSRCQELRFGPLTPEQMTDILSTHPEFEETELRFAARVAHGSAGKAVQLIESGCLEIYDSVLARVLALPEGDAFALTDDVLDWAGSLSRKLEPQRERLRELFRLLSLAYRDMLVLRAGADDDTLFHADPPEPLRRLAGRLSTGRVLRLIRAFCDARRQTDANASIRLVLDNLFERVGDLHRAA